MSQKTWGGRFSGETDNRVEAFTESITFDRRLYRHDLTASKAHARMLAEVGLLTRDEADRVAAALDEIGGGSIRIHDPEVQGRMFRMLGMSDEQARQRFGFLLDALKYGAPPHGGIALGLDRLTMLLAGTTNIRDTIAFPKNKQARDLMTGAPAPVERRQLKELGL